MPTFLTIIFVWFVLSEFQWLQLAIGNIYLKCGCLRGVGVLDEDGLTIRGWGRGETVSNVLKGDRMEKKGGETKLL